jgi:hypothetical protein
MIVDYQQVQTYSKQRMDIEEICAILDYSEDEFRAEMRLDPKIKIALRKGRAEAIANASKVVQDAYDGTLAGTDKDEFQLKAALAFLAIQANGWRKIT